MEMTKKQVFNSVSERVELEWCKLIEYQQKYGSNSPEVKKQHRIWRFLDRLATFLHA